MRVIDLSQGLAGPFAAQMLAELGADVIKVEPPTGDPLRSRAMLDPEDESFTYANRRKRGVTLNLRKREGRDLLLWLVRDADAVLESFRPGTLAQMRLSFRTLRRTNSRVVLTSVTPFGQSGERAGWEESELVLQAMGGIVAATGWEDAPPLKLAGRQAAYIAGLNAATATLAAVYGVRAGATPGVHLDVSVLESLPPHWARHIAQYAYSGTGMRRQSRENGRQGFPDTVTAADGYLYLLALRAEWESFAHFLGLEAFITHEWSEPVERARRWDEIEPHFLASVASRSKHDWFAAASERGYTFAPLDGPLEVLASPQLAARGFFGTAELADGTAVPCPTLPFGATFTAGGENRAPTLGEHNDEIYGEMLGISPSEQAALRGRGII
jgi:crotonobetainyl-CoA:carnitine CoA-transferase CaiB-like acyl-CoA transferase